MKEITMKVDEAMILNFIMQVSEILRVNPKPQNKS